MDPEHTPQTHVVNPDAALASSLLQASQRDKLANRLPDLKKSAYILIALVLFSAFQTFATHQVIVSMLGSQNGGSGFITALSVFGWLVAIIACIVVLTTRNTKTTKLILLSVGMYLIYSTLVGFLDFDIIGTAINLFLIWWTYNLFQSVEALEIKTP